MSSHKDTGISPNDFSNKTFDYLIVGGGTAGLAIAARLSEDPQVTVGVLEAGLWRPNDPKINYPAFIGQSLMDPEYDWALETAPQEHSNSRAYAWPRGKVLGGSSALNFLVWQRGAKAEYEAFESLGNKGWNWGDYKKFSQKTNTFTEPHTELQKANFATSEKGCHGVDGPIQTSFSAWYTEAQAPFFEALKHLGLNNNVDGLRGENTGVWASQATLCAKKFVRSYSTNAYYEPNASRSNLSVLCNAHASKIVLQKSATGHKATGVEFVVDSKSYTVSAKREVIISAGAVHSPQLLELSGIGDPEILKKAGVDVKVTNENVGANLQDHMYCTASYVLKPGFTTWDKMRQDDFAKAAMEQYHSDSPDRGIVASAFSGFAYLPLKQYMTAEDIAECRKEVDALDLTKYTKGAQETIRQQLEWLESESVPSMEYIIAPGFFATASPPKENVEYISILSALQHPFSRGHVHIQSSDASKPPVIDPRYFSVGADLKVLSKAVQWANEKIVKTPSLSAVITETQDPAPEKYKSDEDYKEFVKDFSVTEYHPIGTCSMLPADKGGVVDERLRVYGVSGLRVADASIIPLHISSHIVATCYAIAEKAAHMMKEDAAKGI